MTDVEVVTPPAPPTEDEVNTSKESGPQRDRKERTERPRRQEEEIPDMTVEEATKALRELPKAEPRPDDKDRDEEVAQVNEEIKKIKDQIEAIRLKIDQASEARRAGGDEMDAARAVMRTLKEERDEVRSQLDLMQADSAKAKAALDTHNNSKRALQAGLKYTTVAEIEAAIKEKESRQQTCSMSLSDEKKLVKEIEQLKQSRKTAAQYVTQEEAAGKAKDAHGAARQTESEKKAELRAVQEKLKAAFTVLDELSKARDEGGDDLPNLIEEKKGLHEEINVKIEEIKEIRNKHHGKLDAWYDTQRERRKLKRALDRAEYLERQAVKAARTKAIEEEESKKIPYESEMVLCDTLVAYLETTFLKGTAKAEDAPVPRAASQMSTMADFGGKKMVIKKRDDAEFIVMGGGKKGRGKKKGGGGDKGSVIVHAIDTIESFSLLSMSPPGNKAAVPATIEALKAKKEWFSQQPRGSVPKSKTAQGEKKSGGGGRKEKAPDITDEAFPSLPGMPKPKPVEAEEEGKEEAEGAEEVDTTGEVEKGGEAVNGDTPAATDSAAVASAETETETVKEIALQTPVAIGEVGEPEAVEDNKESEKNVKVEKTEPTVVMEKTSDADAEESESKEAFTVEEEGCADDGVNEK